MDEDLFQMKLEAILREAGQGKEAIGRANVVVRDHFTRIEAQVDLLLGLLNHSSASKARREDE